MIKAVIFDMDGVLVDNAKVHIEAFRIFSERFGRELNVDELMPLFGMGNDEIMPRLLPAEAFETKTAMEIGEEKEALYRELFEKDVCPTRGLLDFLDTLRASGIKTAVGSSGSESNVNFILEKCNIADKFDVVINGDMVAKRKPSPDIYLRAVEMLGLPASECLVFEDAHQGILAARAAGCPVIGLATTFKRATIESWEPDGVIDDFVGFEVF